MTILVIFSGFFGVRFNYSECISKTRHKYVPVGSLMPSMALDGLGYTLRTVKSQCQYRNLNVFVPMLSILASCCLLDFYSIRNSTYPIDGGVPPASMKSGMGIKIGFRKLSVWITTEIMGARVKDYQRGRLGCALAKTVRRMDAAVERTWTYLTRVLARVQPDQILLSKLRKNSVEIHSQAEPLC